MSITISAFFDTAGSAAIRALWADLHAAGLPSMASNRYAGIPPHISLMGTESVEGIDWNVLRRAVGRPQNVLVIEFDGIGFFSSGGGTLFLQAQLTDALAGLQARIRDGLHTQGIVIDPYYLAGSWVPHCTLGIGMSAAQASAGTEMLAGRACLSAEVDRVSIYPRGHRATTIWTIGPA